MLFFSFLFFVSYDIKSSNCFQFPFIYFDLVRKWVRDCVVRWSSLFYVPFFFIKRTQSFQLILYLRRRSLSVFRRRKKNKYPVEIDWMKLQYAKVNICSVKIIFWKLLNLNFRWVAQFELSRSCSVSIFR